MGEEHIRVGAIGPSDGWLGGPKVAEKPEKMPVICETLPPPRKEPISESQSESDSEDDESGKSGEGSGNESDVDLKLCQRLVGSTMYGVHAPRFGIHNPPTLRIQFEPNKCAFPTGKTGHTIHPRI